MSDGPHYHEGEKSGEETCGIDVWNVEDLVRIFIAVVIVAFGIGCSRQRDITHVIVTDSGKALGSPFDGIPPSAFILKHPEILGLRNQGVCDIERELSLMTRLRRLFSVDVVRADECPNTCADPSQCSGMYMVDVGALCFQGCGGQRPLYISWPYNANYWDGYCLNGNTACYPCGSCYEDSCHLI